MNQKLKLVIAKHSGIVQFFKDLLSVIHSMRVEKDHRALKVSLKVPIMTYVDSSPEAAYVEVLTPYAFHFVKNQLEKRKDVVVQQEDGRFNVTTPHGMSNPSPDSCVCGFRTAMFLPCKHMFAVREL